jgi:benzodiazapine receptor
MWVDVLLLLGPNVMGYCVGRFTRRHVSFSNSLTKPPLNPPNRVFPLVWTALYGMMGVASWRVYHSNKGVSVSSALAVYALQLLVNCAWSILYFYCQRIDLALLDSAVLTGLVGWTIRHFHSIDPLSASLLYPYLAWSLFATYLTLGLYTLNGARGVERVRGVAINPTQRTAGRG